MKDSVTFSRIAVFTFVPKLNTILSFLLLNAYEYSDVINTTVNEVQVVRTVHFKGIKVT